VERADRTERVVVHHTERVVVVWIHRGLGEVVRRRKERVLGIRRLWGVVGVVVRGTERIVGDIERVGVVNRMVWVVVIRRAMVVLVHLHLQRTSALRGLVVSKIKRK